MKMRASGSAGRQRAVQIPMQGIIARTHWCMNWGSFAGTGMSEKLFISLDVLMTVERYTELRSAAHATKIRIRIATPARQASGCG